jgi:hypothetical protein
MATVSPAIGDLRSTVLGTEGYSLVADVFADWEPVKDEFVLPARKQGGGGGEDAGNGTVHIYIPVRSGLDTVPGKPFAEVFDKPDKAELKVRHLFLVDNLMTMAAAAERQILETGEALRSGFQANTYLRALLLNPTVKRIGNAPSELVAFESVLRFAGSRLYFKRFDSEFRQLVRPLLFPGGSLYRIGLYRNAAGDHLFGWLLHHENAGTREDAHHLTAEPASAWDDSLPRNLVIYGAPGTGKSMLLDERVKKHRFTHVFRTTFFSEYSHARFAGAFRPVPYYSGKLDEEAYYDSHAAIDEDVSHRRRRRALIDYDFVPGPLLKAVRVALEDSTRRVALVIDELNRAEAPAVFGDFFQLLDRRADGRSRYEVDLPEEMCAYLHGVIDDGRLALPSNLYLWATMNTSDQGVFPIDTAFRRRWQFEFLPLDARAASVPFSTIDFDGVSVPWNAFRKFVNDFLTEKAHVSEDRLLGPFFLGAVEAASLEAVRDKLVSYLHEDVLRHCEVPFFRYKSLSRIYESYGERQVLVDDLAAKLMALGDGASLRNGGAYDLNEAPLISDDGSMAGRADQSAS